VKQYTSDEVSFIMRPSSLGGGRILRRTLSIRLSVRLSVRPSRYPSVTSRHLANENDTHVLFGTRWGPHIVRPSRPHKFLLNLRCIVGKAKLWPLCLSCMEPAGFRFAVY